jgi:hypothetical protein
MMILVGVIDERLLAEREEAGAFGIIAPDAFGGVDQQPE